MITIDIKSASDFDFALTATKSQIQTAAMRALNKTGRWARSQVATDTAKELNIKVSLVRKDLVLIKARKSHPQVVIALGKTAGVVKAKDLGNSVQNSKGVRVGKRQFDNAFMATMPSGHHGVFKRRGKTRLPIREVQIVITGKMRDQMEEISQGRALHQFKTIFERELRYLKRAA